MSEHGRDVCLYPDKKGTTAYRTGCRCRRCKDSQNVWQKSYHKRKPGKAIEYLRRRKYGLEPVDIEEMLRGQNGLCAICKLVSSNLVVDHCHQSRKVRGLLCSNCNTAIGLLGDNVVRCMAAANYLFESLKRE